MPKLLLILLVCLSSSISWAQKKVDCDASFDFMYSQWAKTNVVQYTSAKEERQDGEMVKASFDFTIQREPFKVAGRMSDKGHYILYDTEESTKDAWYISNGFPFTNLSLDVNGKVFRGLNHYTISDAGCNFIFGIIRDQYNVIGDKFWCEKVVRKGNEEISVQAETEDWGYVKYTAKDGETVIDVAAKLSVSAYLIIERNAGVNQFQDDLSGKTIEVPKLYGKKIKLNVDAEHGLPTLIEVYDDKGLLERFEYTAYRFDTKLAPGYFTVDYLDKLH